MSRIRIGGFTIIELLAVIAVLAVILSIVAVSYASWQRHAAANAVNSDLRQAQSALRSYKNFKNSYPPNLAGTGFAGSPNVALTLLTNAPSVGVYQNLTNDQNAQLFLNVCNANITDTTNNTACTFQGNGTGAKIHVTGTESTNTIWSSPVNQVDVTLACGSDQAICDAALTAMKNQFGAQGGTFPITVPDGNVPLPEPTLVPNGQANRYCLQGRAAQYSDVVYYITSDNERILAGECPPDPSLHYYQ